MYWTSERAANRPSRMSSSKIYYTSERSANPASRIDLLDCERDARSMLRIDLVEQREVR